MQRRKFLRQSMIASAGVATGGYSGLAARVRGGTAGAVEGQDFPVVRVAESKRKFKSPMVEKIIREVRTTIGNKEVGWLFENCFPNTLDTTVDFSLAGGRPDTYVI